MKIEIILFHFVDHHGPTRTGPPKLTPKSRTTTCKKQTWTTMNKCCITLCSIQGPKMAPTKHWFCVRSTPGGDDIPENPPDGPRGRLWVPFGSLWDFFFVQFWNMSDDMFVRFGIRFGAGHFYPSKARRNARNGWKIIIIIFYKRHRSTTPWHWLCNKWLKHSSINYCWSVAVLKQHSLVSRETA